MTTEREAFEAWLRSIYRMPSEDKTGAFDAWQASRKVAFEEAANICTGIAIAPSNVVLGVAIECATKIRSLK